MSGSTAGPGVGGPGVKPVERVEAAFARLAEVDRPEVWITLRDRDEVLAEAAGIDPTLPLAGVVARTSLMILSPLRSSGPLRAAHQGPRPFTGDRSRPGGNALECAPAVH